MLRPQSSISSFTIQQYPSPPEGSLAHTFRCETRIANISYQIRSLSNFISAAKDLLDFATLTSNFSMYQNQIINIIELARKTLESAGIVLFLWASCPSKLAEHKASYIELLRMLRANQGHVDTESQRRVRVLLMPLTSHFSTSPSPPPSIPTRLLVTSSTTPSTDSATASNSQESESTSDLQEDSSSSMLPPNEIRQVEPPNRSPVAPRHRRLWDSRELSYASVGPRHRSRSRSPHRFQQQNTEEKLEQENVAPESTIAFRQAPRTQRFGIFLTGRSSMLGNYNRTDRNSSLPAH